ncbi:MAG: DUF222 domain-containing protein [Actinomycetes bacterium]
MAQEAQHLAGQVSNLLAEVPEIRTVTDEALRDELINCDQAAQMLLARRAEAMAEMGRRADRDDRFEQKRLGRPLWSSETRAEFVADEIAISLSCTKAAAARHYAIAREATQLPSVMHAWLAGKIDDRKVAVITEGLAPIDPAYVDAIAATAADYGTTHTAPQLRAWLARKVLAADPSAAEIRLANATSGRRVTVTPLSDGVSELTAILPSIQARQIFDTVNTIAREAGSRDARTMDQRRADALIDLLVGRAEPPQVHVHVMVSADSLASDSNDPGYVPGVGPVAASVARELTSGAPGAVVAHRRLLIDSESGALLDTASYAPLPTVPGAPPYDSRADGATAYRPSQRLEQRVRDRDVTCRFPGCRRSALGKGSGTDLDHTVPWPLGHTDSSNLAVLCRHHHRVKHSPGWSVTTSGQGLLEWTTPAGRRLATHPWTYFEPPEGIDPL